MDLDYRYLDREALRGLEINLSFLMFLPQIPPEDKFTLQCYFSAISKRDDFNDYPSAFELIEKYKFFLPDPR
jgi:hypothetical protein